MCLSIDYLQFSSASQVLQKAETAPVRPHRVRSYGARLGRGGARAPASTNQACPTFLAKTSIEKNTTQLHSQSSARPTFRASPVSRASAESCQQLRPWDLDPPLVRSAFFARRSRPCSRASGSGGTPSFGFALIARAFGGLRTCWTGSSADDDDDDDDSAVCTDAYRL